MKKKLPLIGLIVVLIIVISLFVGIQQTHTYTLSSTEEQIQPIFGTVKVISEHDTDVVFIDVETGEEYTVGYITKGVTEKIKLSKGRWYMVQGTRNITISPVNVRIEGSIPNSV